MVKLNPEYARTVAQAESAGFLIDDGLYKLQLIDVTEQPAKAEDKYPQLIWKLQFPEDAHQYAGRQIWRFVSEAPKAAPFMNESFTAFGGNPETDDTDELIGRFCLVEIVTVLRHNHAHAKDFENKIHKMYPMSGEAVTAGASNGKASAGTPDDMKPLF